MVAEKPPKPSTEGGWRNVWKLAYERDGKQRTAIVAHPDGGMAAIRLLEQHIAEHGGDPTTIRITHIFPADYPFLVHDGSSN